MKRYVSIDFIRGLSIFMMIFLHLLDDLYDLSWTKTNASLGAAPLLNVVFLLAGLYFGSWAGLFLMISATGNMVSMYSSFEKGSSVKSVVMRQVVGGFILLIFAFLVEGTLQYYGLFQTIRSGEMDFTRILWKGYTMETVHTIAWCMIINGIIQGLLSINGGHRKIKRNIIIYAIMAIVVVACTQFVWDWSSAVVNALYPGYPAPGYPLYVLPWNLNRTVQGPVDLFNFGEYLIKFIFLPLDGQPEPIFPFLAVSCIGSIIGLLICQEPNSRKWPKRGVLIGFLIIIAGILIGLIGDMPFSSLLPLSNFSMFRRIGGGVDFLWVPWICIITGGQLIAVAVIFRVVEFRGKSQAFAKKGMFIRRFGMVPFTMYTFHRSLAMIPLSVLSIIFMRDMTIDVHNLDIFTTLGCIAVSILFMHGLMKLWERKDYIGSLEWMIGSIGYAVIKKRVREDEEKVPWYRRGARSQKEIFYDVQWIDIFKEGDNGGIEFRDSKLAFKVAIAGLISIVAFPASIIALGIVKTSARVEGANKYNNRAKIVGWIGLIVNIVVLVVFYFLTLDILGISL